MSKRLTINQIQNKIHMVESRYYKGWNRDEWWWLCSGQPSKQDTTLWLRYRKLLTKRLAEIKYTNLIQQILFRVDPNVYHDDYYVLEKYWFNEDQESNVNRLYDYCERLLVVKNKLEVIDDFKKYRLKATPHEICSYIKTNITDYNQCYAYTKHV